MDSAKPTIELRKVRKNNLNGEKFDSFDVWVDGKHYCSTRYRDFGTFAESIAVDFPNDSLPTFPPKKMNMSFLSLSDEVLEERRQSLEAYMKKAFQIPKFHDSPVVKRFFFEQREMFLENYAKEVEEKIYTSEDLSVVVKFKTSTRTDDLLKLVASALQLSSKHIADFALFEVPLDPNLPEVKYSPFVHPWLCSRGLEFTSEDLSSKGFLYDELVVSEHKPKAKIFIKKWVFSPQRLSDIFKDPAGLKIVFAQAQADVKNKLIFPTGDEKAELRKMAMEGNAKEYMRIIRECRGYGVTYVAPCKANHPTENSKVMPGVSIEGIELHVITGEKRTGEEEVLYFPWEKIRRWKFSEPDKSFSFHFYFSPTQDKWIECETHQFMFFNSVVQEYVEELKRRMQAAGRTFSDEKKEAAEEPKAQEKKEAAKEPAKEAREKKEEPEKPKPVATAPPTSEPKSPKSPKAESDGPPSTLSSKLSGLSLKPGASKKQTENQGFNPMITDDDL